MVSGVWITEGAMSELSHVKDWELLRFWGGGCFKRPLREPLEQWASQCGLGH